MSLYRKNGNSSLWFELADIQPGEKVSKAIIKAAESFALQTGHDPEFAFIEEIPQGAVEFVEVRNVILVKSEWVPRGKVAVGRGGMDKFEPYLEKVEVKNER